MSGGWAHDPDVTPYPEGREFLVDMPVGSPQLPPALKPRRGKPGCSECELGETGVCGRHSYDPLKSLGIVHPAMSDDDRVRWQEVAW